MHWELPNCSLAQDVFRAVTHHIEGVSGSGQFGGCLQLACKMRPVLLPLFAENRGGLVGSEGLEPPTSCL